jgi:hypothetical protein
MKVCSVCESSDYHANGLCVKCYHAARYKANPTKFKLRNAEWSKKNQNKHKLLIERWRKEHPQQCKIISTRTKRKQGILPMSKNRSCSSFLGCHVAEQVLSKTFKNVELMPPNNPGYDFICNHGMKIDVKSSCIHNQKGCSPYWQFNIKKNKIADYFLCIAFDNRIDLNPLHLWLIPGNTLNHSSSARIALSTILKWIEFELDAVNVVKCCDSMK